MLTRTSREDKRLPDLDVPTRIALDHSRPARIACDSLRPPSLFAPTLSLSLSPLPANGRPPPLLSPGVITVVLAGRKGGMHACRRTIAEGSGSGDQAAKQQRKRRDAAGGGATEEQESCCVVSACMRRNAASLSLFSLLFSLARLLRPLGRLWPPLAWRDGLSGFVDEPGGRAFGGAEESGRERESSLKCWRCA